MRAPETPPTPRFARGALIVSGLLWGTTWIPLRHFSRAGLSGVGMTFLSYGVVGLLSLPWIFRERAAWRSQQALFLAAALAGGGANVCFVSGLVLGEVVRVMLLFYLAPVWALLGGWFWLGEAISWRRALGVGAAVSGAGLILWGDRAGSEPASLADLLGLGSGLLYAAQNIAFRAANRVPVLSKTLSIFTASAAIAGSVSILQGSGVPPVSGLLLLELTLFAGGWVGAAMWTTMYGVTHLEAGRAAVLLVFELVAAVGSALILGDERMSLREGWGAALIVGAAFLEARSAAPG